MKFAVLLADGDYDLFSFWTNPASGAHEILLVVGVMVALVLLVFIWAAFWRKPPRHKHAYHHDPSADLPRRRKKKSGFLGAFRGGKGRRHRRRRGEDERPVNPTLAQVGGLPPPRRDPPRHD